MMWENKNIYNKVREKDEERENHDKLIRKIYEDRILGGNCGALVKIAQKIREEQYKITQSHLDEIKIKEEAIKDKYPNSDKRRYADRLKKIATLSEMIFVLKGNEIFGEDAQVFLSSLYDDFKHGIDLVVSIPKFSSHIDEKVKEENPFHKYQLLAVGLDVTFGSYEALRKKMDVLKDEVKDFSFVSPTYLPWEIKMGEKIEIPHLIVYFPLEVLDEIAEKINLVKFPGIGDIEEKIDKAEKEKEKLDIHSLLNYLSKIKEICDEEVKLEHLALVQYFPFAIYNQIFIQVQFWKEELSKEIAKKEKELENVKNSIDEIEKKIKALNDKSSSVKRHLSLVKHNETLKLAELRRYVLNLRLKLNTLDFVEVYFKSAIDIKRDNNVFVDEDKKEISDYIVQTNKDFAYHFLKNVKYQNKKEKIEEEEIENLIKTNIYLP